MIRRWQGWVIGVLAACFLSVVLAHAYVGSFSRMMADTYCYAVNVSTYGLLGAQRIWYTGWTGRFSFNLIESLTGWAGPPLIPLLPPFVLLLWSTALVSLAAQLRLSADRWLALGAALLLSTLILAITLSDIDLVSQSLYWSSGMTNYVPPLILGTAFASLLVYASRRANWSKTTRVVLTIVAAGMPLVAGGFSEIYGALQLVALVVLCLGLWVYGAGVQRRRLLPLGVAGVLCAALALIIVIIAPGNKIRAANFPPPPHLPALIGLAVQLTVSFLQKTFLSHPLNLSAAVVIPGALAAWLLAADSLARFPTRNLVRVMLWTPIIVLGLLLAGFAVAAYGLSSSPPARAQIVPQFCLTAGLVIWGLAVGGTIRQADLGKLLGREVYLWQAALVGWLALCGLRGAQLAQQTFSTQTPYAAYALAWDDTNRLIQSARAQGLTRVSVPPLRNVSNLEEAGADPNNWVNQCVSRYDGLLVVANPPLPAPEPAELQRSTPLDGRIGDVAQVEGYTLDKDHLRAGDTLSVTVYWRPQAITSHPYTVFVHLYDPASGSISQVDTYPAQGVYPTTRWVYDHVFADTYRLTVPAQFTDSRQAEIVLGLYDLQTLQRLPVTGADAQADQAWVRFGNIRVN